MARTQSRQDGRDAAAMDAWCSGCGVKYTFDPAKVPAEGVNVRCTRCNAVFRVDANEPAAAAQPNVASGHRSTPPMRRPQTTPPTRAAAPRMRGASQDPLWTVRHGDGTTLQFRDMTTLQKWVVEQKVSRADEISRDGETWNTLGELSELQSFFSIVDAANARGYFGSQPPVDFDGEATVPYPASARASMPSDSDTGLGDDLAASDSTPLAGLDLSLRADATVPIPEQVLESGADATQPMSLSELAASYESEASGSASSATSQAPSPAAPTSPANEGAAPSIAEAISSGATDSGSFWATEISSALRTGELSPIPDDDTIAYWQKKGRKTQVRWGGAFAVAILGVGAYLTWPIVEPVLYELAGGVPPQAARPAEVSAPNGAEANAESRSAPEGEQVASAGEAKKTSADSAAAKPAPKSAQPVLQKVAAPSPSSSQTPASVSPSAPPAKVALAAPQAAAHAAANTPSTASATPSSAPQTDPQALLQRAERLRESDRTAEALALYREASELAPSDPRVSTGMGWCYVDLERFADATRVFADVLKSHPRDALSHFGLAEASRAMGDAEQARDSYRKYLEIAPQGPDARIARLALDELEKSP